MLTCDPALAARADRSLPGPARARAAEENCLEAMALLIDLGFDVNVSNRPALCTGRRCAATWR
jgi:hypothetical protein